MAVITLEAVSKAFGGQTLYQDVSFEIEEGSIVAVTGPNASGKSVLLRIMCGFLLPDSGMATIDKRFLSRGRTFPEEFGVVIDRPGYIAGKTGLNNLRELASIRGVIGDDEIRHTMNMLSLDPDIRQRVRHYSLGMKQKLAIAQALMESPQVLILDEPFNALDARSVSNVKRILKDLNSQGVTIVFTSHNERDIDDLTTRRLVIRDQRIVARRRPGPK